MRHLTRYAAARTSPGTPWAALALALCVTLGACGSEAADAPRTDETTSNLLAAAREDGAASTMPSQQAPPSAAPAGRIDVALLGRNYGSDDAPVRVVELSDYGCGYCRRFHQETWPALLDEYVESGKVQWKFLPFVTGMFGNSPVATEGVECALAQGEELFDRMSDRVWDDQSAWKGGSDPHATVREMANAAGLDMAAWDACMDQDSRNDRVLAGTELARQLGVRGTPTFYVVGYPPMQGALPTETFRKILDLVYEDAQERLGG